MGPTPLSHLTPNCAGVSHRSQRGQCSICQVVSIVTNLQQPQCQYLAQAVLADQRECREAVPDGRGTKCKQKPLLVVRMVLRWKGRCPKHATQDPPLLLPATGTGARVSCCQPPPSAQVDPEFRGQRLGPLLSVCDVRSHCQTVWEITHRSS